MLSCLVRVCSTTNTFQREGSLFKCAHNSGRYPGYMPRQVVEWAINNKGEEFQRVVTENYLYSHVAPDVWLPVTAKRKLYTVNKPRAFQLEITNTITLTPIAINKGIPDNQFMLLFPKGTTVMDVSATGDPLGAAKGRESFGGGKARTKVGEGNR